MPARLNTIFRNKTTNIHKSGQKTKLISTNKGYYKITLLRQI